MINSVQKNQLEQDIWQQLLRASVDRHHEWRSLVLVTNGFLTEFNQWPEARVVILRAVNVNQKELTFYTDSRSPKIAQIAANPYATLVFWSKRLNWQLRIKVNLTIDINSDLAQKAWQKVKQSPSAGDYLSHKVPGKNLDNNLNKTQQMTSNTTTYFALLIAKVVEIDWLALDRNGHQRALISAQGIQFLVP